MNEKIFRIITFIFIFIFLSTIVSERLSINKNEYVAEIKTDIDIFIDALIWCESRGQHDIVNHSSDATGVLQITCIYVKEVNRILEEQKSDLRFTLNDRFDSIKSKEMFFIHQTYHNPTFDFKTALRQHRGKHSKSYNNAVMKKYNELKKEYSK